MPRLSIMTTSWDDGDPCDLKVAELLRARGLAGTFYIPLIGYDGRRTAFLWASLAGPSKIPSEPQEVPPCTR